MKTAIVAGSVAFGVLVGMPIASATDVPSPKQLDPSVQAVEVATEKAASARTVAARAIVAGNQTVFGGFELATSATVYVLVRGNSLGTLGVTSNFQDLPRVRLYNSAGQDLVTDPNPGFNTCLASAATDAPVVNYYQNVRGQPVDSRDGCIAGQFTAGAFTFSVTPSTTSSRNGEILFEVTLGP